MKGGRKADGPSPQRDRSQRRGKGRCPGAVAKGSERKHFSNLPNSQAGAHAFKDARINLDTETKNMVMNIIHELQALNAGEEAATARGQRIADQKNKVKQSDSKSSDYEKGKSTPVPFHLDEEARQRYKAIRHEEKEQARNMKLLKTLTESDRKSAKTAITSRPRKAEGEQQVDNEVPLKQKVRLTLTVEGKSGEMKTIVMSRTAKLDDILKTAKSKFNLKKKPQFIYLAATKERISSLSAILDDTVLLLANSELPSLAQEEKVEDREDKMKPEVYVTPTPAPDAADHEVLKQVKDLYNSRTSDVALVKLDETEVALESSRLLNHQREIEINDPGGRLKKRRQLPIAALKRDILDRVQANQVIVLCGSTGCGKTTQVPQFLLEQWVERNAGGKCNILVTQPRRISAVSVAERVAYERSERIGSTVGYQIRLESRVSAHSRLKFCTIGVLLRHLQNDRNLTNLTHLIIDEVHERELLSDFLLIILKRLLVHRPDLKLILMSATINAELFSKYFGECPVVEVPGRYYDVRDVFLEEILRLCPRYRLSLEQERRRMTLGPRLTRRPEEEEGVTARADERRHQWISSLGSSCDSRVKDILSRINEEKVNFPLIEHILYYIDGVETSAQVATRSKGSVLIFLPGMAEIQALCEYLRQTQGTRTRYLIVPLHSSVEMSQQKKAFDNPPPGVRKVVIATNIAETSITIDDVSYVIDSGKVKQLRHDSRTAMNLLEEIWVSAASSQQRRGRAGRTGPGICFRLYSSWQFREFKPYSVPEMLRVSLENIILQIKMLELGNAQQLLEEALEPPSRGEIDKATRALQALNALTSDMELTPLGFHLGLLPVEARLGKMMILASIFGCVDPILVIAASLSSKSPFLAPMDKLQEANEAKMRFAVSGSDHLTMYNAYRKWKAIYERGEKGANDFCRENFLSRNSLLMIQGMRNQFERLLGIIGFAGEEGQLNRNSENKSLLTCIIAAGLYPHVVKKVFQERSLLFSRTERVAIHPSSINARVQSSKKGPQWLVYLEKVKTSQVFVRESTFVSPLAFLLFCGELIVDHGQQRLAVDDFVQFKAPPNVGILFKLFRHQLDALLTKKIRNPVQNISDDPAAAVVIKGLLQLLGSETLTEEEIDDI